MSGIWFSHHKNHIKWDKSVISVITVRQGAGTKRDGFWRGTRPDRQRDVEETERWRSVAQRGLWQALVCAQRGSVNQCAENVLW